MLERIYHARSVLIHKQVTKKIFFLNFKISKYHNSSYVLINDVFISLVSIEAEVWW